jgi:molybdate transport system ATP-binding protein
VSALLVAARAQLGATALDVDVEVRAGQCLALAGPSGAGKTSVLRAVAGLLRPEGGRIACGDELWLDTGRGVFRAPEERACGYLFQEYALFPHLRAWENVAYPLRDVPRRERRGRATELLARFGVEHLAEERPRTLSGGERQRVALARALARSPKALLLDEPLSALDAGTRRDATRALATVLRDAGVPAVLVTHDFAEAAELGDRVGIMAGGRIVQEGSASEVAAAPASAFVAGFAGAVVLTGTASAGPSGLTAIALDGGGTVFSTDAAAGPVAASVYPWEIALEPASARGSASSPRNSVAARVVTTTVLGNRVRVALDAPQPLVAEITAAAAQQLALAPGVPVAAAWKATVTRLTPR